MWIVLNGVIGVKRGTVSEKLRNPREQINVIMRASQQQEKGLEAETYPMLKNILLMIVIYIIFNIIWQINSKYMDTPIFKIH